MKSFVLGEGLKVDLATLIDTRLLVQANSGGGKSRTIRRLLEQTHGAVQHLVIDLEGEFASLREKFDYVVAAKGGDTPADPRSAALLAERLLELKVSAILDIYELKHHDRIRFVKLFLEALVNARKDLWHPALVIVDEAHVFCPQQGEAESAAAVIDLCTRGRKRGFCAVLATQRLSKLHKDAAAECNNKLIGRSAMDVDMKRAADELGFTGKEQMLTLRTLDPGQFYAFGPALSRQVQQVMVGPVETTHPKAGARIAFTAPPPTEKVRALLPQLADLPAEVEQRAQTVASLQQENAALKRAMAGSRKIPTGSIKIQEKRVDVLTKADRAQLEQLATVLTARAGDLRDTTTAMISQAAEAFERVIVRLEAVHAGHQREFIERLEKAGFQKILGKLATVQADADRVQVRPRQVLRRPIVTPVQARPRPAAKASTNGASSDAITAGKQKILNGLAFLHGIGVTPADKTQLALMVGVSPTSGGYFNNLGSLRSSGLIDYPSSGTVALTSEGQALAATDGVPSTTDELHAAIQRKLPKAKWRILEVLIDKYPDAVSKDDLAAQIDVSPTSGGYFNNLGSLRSLGLVDYPRPGTVAAQSVLFLE